MEESTKKTRVDKKPKMALWKKIFIAGVAIIIVLIFVVNAATSGVTKVSNEFLKDLQSGNTEGSYALLSTEAAAATNKSDFKDVVDEAGPILNTKANMTSKEVSGETGKAGTGKVMYEIKGTDNLTYTVTINLTKENGVWKVLNFESTLKK